MSPFLRRRRIVRDEVAAENAAEPDQAADAASAAQPVDHDLDQQVDAPDGEQHSVFPPRPDGPFDASEIGPAAPDGDGTDSSGPQLIDLGGLMLPAREGMELRLEMEEDQSERVIAVTVVLGRSTLQLQGFAAPRSSGIWAEVRADLVAAVTGQGGTAEELDGPFGTELVATIPSQGPDGRTGAPDVRRFVGVDAPRWFLRGVLSGPAAVPGAAAKDLEEVLRGTVVVRGEAAMPPRELLPLRLPAIEGAPPAPVAAAGADQLRPFERGPEITEVR